MNWMKNVLSITVLSLCVIATGCRSPKMPLTPAQQGAVVGGTGGAVVGGVIAQNANASLSSWQGAGAGAVAGVAAGALVGDALDEYAYDNASGMKDKDAQINDLQRQLADAEAKLRGQGMDNVKVEAVNGQLRFTILNEVLFESGKAELKTGSKSTIDSVLNIIQSDFANRDITIEGHTDSDPIMKSKWKDNWELSYNRSIAVLYYLMNEKGIPAERLKAVACADSQPVAPNDSAANKRLNRRAVIVVMPAKDSIIVEKK